MMNIYRMIADGSHVLACLLLLSKFWITKSANGISARTQILFAITYTLRYLDLGLYFISWYNSVMKIFFITISCFIVFAIYVLLKKTYQREHDTFRIELLILPITILSYFYHDGGRFNVIEILYMWSIYMEAVALIPQYFMIWKLRSADVCMISYIFLMTLYRGMYIVNWIYRYNHEHYFDNIVSTSGVVEASVGQFGVLFTIFVTLRSKYDLYRSNKKVLSIYVLPSVHEQFEKDTKILLNEKDDAKVNIAKESRCEIV